MIEKKKNQTSSLINQVENRKQDIETSLNLIGMVEVEIRSSLISQRDQIISFGHQLKLQHPDPESEARIDQHQQILLQQLDDKSKEKVDRLAQQRKQLERDLDCLENSISFSRSLLKNATDQQLFSHLPLITDQLNRLGQDKSFNQPPVETTHFEVEIIKKEEKRGSEQINDNLEDDLKTIKVEERRSEEVIGALKKAQSLMIANQLNNQISRLHLHPLPLPLLLLRHLFRPPHSLL